MAKTWHSHEFSAKETVVGHGAESVGHQVRDFLEQERITGGPLLMSMYVKEADSFHNEPVVHAVLLYRK